MVGPVCQCYLTSTGMGDRVTIRFNIPNDLWPLDPLAQAVFDLIPHGLMVVDSRLQIVLHNASARRFMAVAGSDLASGFGNLRFSAQSRRRSLRQLLREILDGRRVSGALKVVDVGADGFEKTQYFLTATSMESRMGTPGEYVFLSAIDAESVFIPDPAILRDLFNVTAAEADLLGKIGSGYSVAEVATDREVRISTVRSQLSSVLQKMGVHRQASLVALLGQIGSPSGKIMKKRRNSTFDDQESL